MHARCLKLLYQCGDSSRCPSTRLVEMKAKPVAKLAIEVLMHRGRRADRPAFCAQAGVPSSRGAGRIGCCSEILHREVTFMCSLSSVERG